MATLTQEQTDFLKSHHIPMDKTFDASGLSSKEYKARMKENGALVAYGVPPCPKGHTLKNKQANCLQCNPQAIASLKRQATPGEVYIAVSPSQLLAKISLVENASDIIQQLNSENHAEINDWALAMIGRTDSIGQMENHLQQRLADYQVPRKLTADGKTTKASGVYDIDVHDALEVINEMPFTLSEIDNAVMDDFHARYSDKQLREQQQTEQLAMEEAARKQAELAEQARQKQAKLEEQRQRQQQAKQQKLAQKQQRQQQFEAKKAQKQQKIATQVKHSQLEGALVATPKSSSIRQSPQGFFDNQKNVIWLMIAIAVILAIMLTAYAMLK